MGDTGFRSGILLSLVGLWLVLRTVTSDDSGRTLIDHILGKAANWKGSSGAISASGTAPAVATPITFTPSPAAAVNVTPGAPATLRRGGTAAGKTIRLTVGGVAVPF